MLIEGTFNTSPYVIEVAVKGEKLRTIHKLPYFPDRIVQHANALNLYFKYATKAQIKWKNYQGFKLSA